MSRPLRVEFTVALHHVTSLDNDYTELTITSAHAVFVERLPLIHKDPFARILVAQATAEGFTLLTADGTVARYPGPIELV